MTYFLPTFTEENPLTLESIERVGAESAAPALFTLCLLLLLERKEARLPLSFEMEKSEALEVKHLGIRWKRTASGRFERLVALDVIEV